MEDSPTLPGLTDGDGSTRPPLVESVRRTFAALDAAGLLREEHAAPMELALYLADLLAYARVSRGASVAMLARELRETLALLPERVSDEDADAWRQFETDFRAAANRDTP